MNQEFNQHLFTKQRFVLAALLAVVVVVGILFMPSEEYIADPMAMRCETVSLINDGSLAIPKEVAQSFGERGQFFVENVTKEKWYCKYGIFNGLFYFPVLLIQKWHDGTLEYFSPSRVIYLNFFNLLLAMASAVYLFLIASRYTKYPVVSVVFVIAAFYATYWWNYLRAHNSEIYQTLFMLGCYYHLVRSSDGLKSRQQEVLAGLFFAALILTKVVYVILLPIIGIFLILVQWPSSQKLLAPLQRIRSLFCSFALLVFLLLSLWV